MKNNSEKSAKHNYHRPQVLDYGNLNRITASSGTSSTNRDSTGGPPNKTA
jgi:hypothetical protein